MAFRPITNDDSTDILRKPLKELISILGGESVEEVYPLMNVNKRGVSVEWIAGFWHQIYVCVYELDDGTARVIRRESNPVSDGDRAITIPSDWVGERPCSLALLESIMKKLNRAGIRTVEDFGAGQFLDGYTVKITFNDVNQKMVELTCPDYSTNRQIRKIGDEATRLVWCTDSQLKRRDWWARKRNSWRQLTSRLTRRRN